MDDDRSDDDRVLVMAEAKAGGTPVLAFPEGAAVEIVEDGASGFLVADEDELAALQDELVSAIEALTARKVERS